MSALKFLIVEDDFYIARNLKEQIQKIGYEVIAIAGNTIDAISAFNENKPDFVIMDIELPDSREAGIHLTKNFKSIDKNVIIIYYTNLIRESELMQKAINTLSDGILSKKANLEELIININNIIRKKTVMIEDETEVRKDVNSFWIKNAGVYKKITFDSICWIQSADKMVNIFTETESLIFSSTLKYLERKIAKDYLVRTSTSFIINLKKAFDLNKKYRSIKVRREQGDKEIPISDAFFDNLVNSLNIIMTR